MNTGILSFSTVNKKAGDKRTGFFIDSIRS